MSEPSRHRTVLFVSNLFPDTSIPHFGLDNATLLGQLQRIHGWNVRVICPRPVLSPARFWAVNGGWSPRNSDAAWHPVFLPVLYIPKLGSRFNHLLMAARLRGTMRRMNGEFDVVLASWLYPDAWAAADGARRLGKSCVTITQGSDTHQYLDDPVRRRVILQAIEQSSAVIARSKDLGVRLVREGVSAGKVHPVYNGVDTAIFRPQAQNEARETLRRPLGDRILLYVGNFLDVKNPHLLIEAFGGFRQTAEGASATLVMIGAGPMRPALEQKASELGIASAVHFTGPLASTQIAQWMAASDWLCMSSRNEGLPNVILEALACGLPVLATRVGGIHEVVNDPSVGRLTPESDLQQYVAALVEMSQAQWDRAKIAHYGAQFSWERCAGAYDRLLNAALV